MSTSFHAVQVPVWSSCRRAASSSKGCHFGGISFTSYTGGMSRVAGECGCGPGFTLSENDECIECAIGHYKELPGNGACSACPLGSKAPSVGATSCTPCEIGEFQNSLGQGSCIPCDARLSSARGSAECDVCAETFFRKDAFTSATQELCLVCIEGQTFACPSLKECFY